MTIMNVIGIIMTTIIVVVGVIVITYLRKKKDDLDGFVGVYRNEDVNDKQDKN